MAFPDSNSGWTEEEEEILRRMWGEGASATAIANALENRTRNAVLGKADRLHLPTRSNKSREAPKARKRAMPKTPFMFGSGRKKGYRPVMNRADAPVPLEGITVLTMQGIHCKWPVAGEGQQTLFCGHGRESGKPYCRYHVRLSLYG